MILRNTLNKSITLCLAMTLACIAAEKGDLVPTRRETAETARLINEQKAAGDLFPTRGEALSCADRLAQDWADQYKPFAGGFSTREAVRGSCRRRSEARRSVNRRSLSPLGISRPWNNSYEVMTTFFGAPGGEGRGAPAHSKHGQEGSFARPRSRGEGVRTPTNLYDVVTDGKQHGVTLSGEDLLRLMIWQDNNGNFLWAYHETDRQVKGELVLPDAVQGNKRYPK